MKSLRTATVPVAEATSPQPSPPEAEGEKSASVIGRMAVIRVAGEQYVGTVIDAVAGEPGRAKRMRIQSPGARQGDVVQPSEYIFLEWDTD